MANKQPSSIRSKISSDDDEPLDLQPLEDDDEPLDIQPVEPEQQSLFSRAGNFLTTPLTNKPSEWAHELTKRDEATTPDVGMKGDNSWADTDKWLRASGEGFKRGIVEGVGDFASSLSTPLNLGLTALGMGEAAGIKGMVRGIKAGKDISTLSKVTRAAGKVRQGIGVGVTGEGAKHLYDEGLDTSTDSFGRRAGALGEIAGGLSMVGQNAVGKVPSRPTVTSANVPPTQPQITSGEIIPSGSSRKAPNPATGPFVKPNVVQGEIIPPATPAPSGNHTELVIQKPSMEVVTTLTNEGWIASEQVAGGGIKFIRPNIPPALTPKSTGPIAPPVVKGPPEPTYGINPANRPTGPAGAPTPQELRRSQVTTDFGEEVVPADIEPSTPPVTPEGVNPLFREHYERVARNRPTLDEPKPEEPQIHDLLEQLRTSLNKDKGIAEPAVHDFDEPDTFEPEFPIPQRAALPEIGKGMASNREIIERSRGLEQLFTPTETAAMVPGGHEFQPDMIREPEMMDEPVQVHPDELAPPDDFNQAHEDTLGEPEIPVQPSAKFLGWQDQFDDEGSHLPQYNIEGGPYHGSTVGPDKLGELGIEAPEPTSPNPQFANQVLQAEPNLNDLNISNMTDFLNPNKQGAKFGRQIMGEDEPLFHDESSDDIQFSRAPKKPNEYFDIEPDRYKRYKVYDENDKLIYETHDENESQTFADVENGYVVDTGESDPNEPSFARSDKGGIKVGQNIKRSISEVTTGYSTPLPGVMVREGLQNAKDAIGHLGDNGQIHITVGDDGITITDNGKGMDRNEIETVFSNLFESGKANDKGATGGKGIGKATYMFGGEHFSATTVKRNKQGQMTEITISGTPDEFEEHVDVQERIVPDDTPTGTTITTKFKAGQEPLYGRTMVSDVLKYSRGLKGSVTANLYGSDNTKKFNDGVGDKRIGQENIDGNDVELIIPNTAKLDERQSINLVVLNNGMYQFNKYHYLAQKTPHMPDNLIVSVKPSVEEGTPDYPFPTQRESLKDKIQSQIDDLIKKRLVDPEANKRKNVLQELYNSMQGFNRDPADVTRDSVLFDPGERLTGVESDRFTNSGVVQDLIQHTDDAIAAVLDQIGRSKWSERLEKVGIVLDDGMYGVHIPNPTTGKSAILINHFLHMGSKTPKEAAFGTAITILHEVAHIGDEMGNMSAPKFGGELQDPEGKFFQSYLDQVHTHGGLNPGHAVGWIQRLGEVYAKFGAKLTFEVADGIEALITDRSGGYSPEVQELLRIYQESRGRPEVTTDFLSRTGDKQKSGSGGKGSIPGSNKSNGAGNSGESVYLRNPSIEQFRDMLDNGYQYSGEQREDGAFKFFKTGKKSNRPVLESEIGSKVKGGPKPPEKVGLARQIYDAPRGLMSIDPPFITSAAFRQAAPHMFTKNWFQSWGDAATSFGDKAVYEQKMKNILESAPFRPRPIGKDKLGNVKFGPSFAKEIGLRMVDLQDMNSARMEGIKANIAEKIPGYGSYVKASNRAYAAFLNELRARQLEQYIKDSKALAATHNDPMMDITKNIPLAKEFAEWLNDTTGSGTLKTEIGVRWGDKKLTTGQYSLEKHAQKVADVLFSPRLTARNIRMLNPSTYIMASPQIRKKYLGSFMRLVGAWMGFTQLAKLAGFDVVLDPNNPDFMKVKIGDTRFDPAAGIQQFMVALSREKPAFMHIPQLKDTSTGFLPVDAVANYLGTPGGQYSSSISGETRQFGVGINPRTRTSNAIDFMAQKMHPTAKLLYDIGNADERRPVYAMDRVAQMALPMFAGDLAELSQTDPEMLFLIMPFSGMGGGTQTYDGSIIKPQFTPLIGADQFDYQWGGPQGRHRQDRPNRRSR